MAEYFRDEKREDGGAAATCCSSWTTFIVHGWQTEYRRLLGRMPSAVGYQPTLGRREGVLQERITSTKTGSITSISRVRSC